MITSAPRNPVAEHLAPAELVAVHCRSCGLSAFPHHPSCPRCGSVDVEATHLPATGRVVATTRTGGAQVCEVRLDNGLLVLGAVESSSPVHVGDRVSHVPHPTIVRFRTHA